jgi:hypothetical protein
MTAKFEAFKAALNALCVEHGVRLSQETDYDGYHDINVEEAGEHRQAGLFIEITDIVPPTPEDLAAQAKREAEWRERLAAYEAQRRADFVAEEEKRMAALMQNGDYMNLQAAIEAHAKEQRKQLMRVSTDPTDPAYIDARPRRAWCNDVLIEGWVIADEFRRFRGRASGNVTTLPGHRYRLRRHVRARAGREARACGRSRARARCRAHPNEEGA